MVPKEEPANAGIALKAPVSATSTSNPMSTSFGSARFSDVGQTEWAHPAGEDIVSTLSLVSAPSSESTAACAMHNVAARREKPSQEAAVAHPGGGRLRGEDRAHAKTMAPTAMCQGASKCSGKVRLTEATLDSDRVGGNCTVASPQELWQTRLSLFSDQPVPPRTALATPEAWHGDGWECEGVDMETSAASGSGQEDDADLSEQEELWHRRLCLYFDSRKDDPYCLASLHSSSTRPVESAALDLDQEELEEVFSQWLSFEQMKPVEPQATTAVAADPKKPSSEAKCWYSLNGYSLCHAAIIAVVILAPVVVLSVF
mmetsp:Transcript_104227/g.270103  ORF Transcript_104227/g.270103 Transcript_104227/m.270103 type:complete len:315 (-) Transcript_104227:93-1037(-)